MADSCPTGNCGTGGWAGPLPGDPGNATTLSAVGSYGGIEVTWEYPALNPHAVAHVLLYRNTVANLATAPSPRVVAGNRFFDRIDSPQSLGPYYYWVQTVSVNGTPGEVAGPANATARPTISKFLDDLNGLLDQSALSQDLRTEIGKIPLLGNSISQEVSNRIAAVNSLSTALGQVQSGLDGAFTLIEQTRTKQQTDNSALVAALDLYAASFNNGIAGVAQSVTAQVNATSALAQRLDTVEVSLDGNVATGEAGLKALYQSLDGRVTSIGAAYTAKVQVNGLIGGFGVYNNGTTVDAAFDVDRFWIGKEGSASRRPFIVQGGEVFINKAVIGTVTADMIDSRGLSIRDASGNIIFSAGQPLSHTNIAASSDWLNTNITVGRNLVRGLHAWTVYGGLSVQGEVRAGDGRALKINASSNYESADSQNLSLPFNNAPYTVSFMAYVSSGTRELRVDLNPDTLPEQVFTVTTTPKLYTVTWNLNPANHSAAAFCRMRFFAPAGAGDLIIYNPKLEYGSSNTPWSPHEADTQNESIQLNGSGQLLGIGAGAGTTVSNSQIGINASGQLYGAGAGNGLTISNNQIQVAGGVLTGIGTANVAVDNSYVAPNNNFFPNSDQAANVVTWVTTYNPNGAVMVDAATALSNSAWTQDTYVLDGQTKNAYVKQVGVATGTVDGSGDSAVAVDIWCKEWTNGRSVWVPALPGERFIASCYMWTERCTAGLYLAFYNSAGIALGYLYTGRAARGTGTYPNLLSNYQRVSISGAAPDNTAYVQMFVRKHNTLAGQLDSTVFLAAPQLERAGTNQTTPSPYVPGPVTSTRQAGYNGDLNATNGATWGSNVSGRPANLAALGGTEVVRNDQIGINASGQVYGMGAGNGVTVSNNQIQVAGGQLTGIGTSGVVVDNSYAAFSAGPNSMWDFTTSALSWTAYQQASLSFNGTAMVVTSTGVDPIISISGLSLPGGTFTRIRARVRRTAGSGWDGTCYYATAGHGWSGSYYKAHPSTATTGQWVVLEWDMANLDGGGTDWVSNTITSLRLDLGASASDVFEIDWIAVGRMGPVQIRELGYTGAMDATRGATIGVDLAGQINTGNVSSYLEAGVIDNLYIGPFIQSRNFNGVINAAGQILNYGNQGWAIGKAGNAVFSGVLIRSSATGNVLLDATASRGPWIQAVDGANGAGVSLRGDTDPNTNTATLKGLAAGDGIEIEAQPAQVLIRSLASEKDSVELHADRVSSSVIVGNITNWRLPLPANKTCLIRGYIWWESVSAFTGMTIGAQLQTDAGAVVNTGLPMTFSVQSALGGGGSDNLVASSTTGSAQVLVSGNSAANVRHIMEFTALVKTGTSPVLFQPRFATEVNASNVTIYAGSWMSLQTARRLSSELAVALQASAGMAASYSATNVMLEGAPATSLLSLLVKPNGTWSVINQATQVASGSWLTGSPTAGIGSEYEVRATVTAGSGTYSVSNSISEFKAVTAQQTVRISCTAGSGEMVSGQATITWFARKIGTATETQMGSSIFYISAESDMAF